MIMKSQISWAMIRKFPTYEDSKGRSRERES